MCAAPVMSPRLRDVADGLLADLPALSDDLAALLAEKDRFYRDVDQRAPDRFRQVCASHLKQALTGVADGCSGISPDVRQAALEHVHVDASLTPVFGALRVFGGFVQAAMLRQLAGQDSTSPSMLVRLVGTVWVSIEAYAELVAGVYREAGDQAWSSALEGLLTGRMVPGLDLDDTARLLGLPLHGVFAVVVGPTGTAALVEGRRWRVAWRSGPDADIGIVVADRVSDLVLVQRALAGIPFGVGISAAFGDLAETPTAVRQARIAGRCLGPGVAGAVRYGARPLVNLIAAAPVQAGDHARAVLAGILTAAVAEREMLLCTLRAWYDDRGVAKEAARRLYVHPNTVRYRLRRIQELTGLDLANPRDIAELYVALEAIRLDP